MLYECVTCAVTLGPMLGVTCCCHHLKNLTFWKRSPYFHLSPGPTNDVAGFGWNKTGLGVTWKAVSNTEATWSLFCFHLQCYCYLVFLPSCLYSEPSSLRCTLLINSEHNWLCNVEKESMTQNLPLLHEKLCVPGHTPLSLTVAASSLSIRNRLPTIPQFKLFYNNQMQQNPGIIEICIFACPAGIFFEIRTLKNFPFFQTGAIHQSHVLFWLVRLGSWVWWVRIGPLGPGKERRQYS